MDGGKTLILVAEEWHVSPEDWDKIPEGKPRYKTLRCSDAQILNLDLSALDGIMDVCWMRYDAATGLITTKLIEK